MTPSTTSHEGKERTPHERIVEALMRERRLSREQAEKEILRWKIEQVFSHRPFHD